MVTFGDIQSKNLRVNYVKEDMEDFKVTGVVNYNKDNKVTEANGDIRDLEGKRLANFNVYGEGDAARINLTDCLAGRMTEAIGIAEATLYDLASNYPE